MKRIGGRWEEVTSFSNLLGAARRAAAGKRTRPDVAEFLMNLEYELAGLREQVLGRSAFRIRRGTMRSRSRPHGFS